MSGKMIKNGLAKLLWNINKISSSEMSVIIPDCTGQLRVISTAYNRSTSRIQYVYTYMYRKYMLNLLVLVFYHLRTFNIR